MLRYNQIPSTRKDVLINTLTDLALVSGVDIADASDVFALAQALKVDIDDLPQLRYEVNDRLETRRYYMKSLDPAIERERERQGYELRLKAQSRTFENILLCIFVGGLIFVAIFAAIFRNHFN